MNLQSYLRFADNFNVNRASQPRSETVKKETVANQIGEVLASEQSLKTLFERAVSFLRKIPLIDVYGQEGAFFIVVAILSILFWQQHGLKLFFVIPIFRLTRRAGLVPGAITSVIGGLFCSFIDFKIQGPPALYIGLILNCMALLCVALMSNSLNDRLIQVRDQAETDALTGTLNRFGFDRAMTEMFEEVSQTKENVVLGVIDLDEFKMLNDVYGHAFGDSVLKAVKTCVDPAIAEGGLLARMGGDEFIVVVTGLDLEEARVRMQRARIRFKRSSTLLGQQATFSFGLASVTGAGNDLDALIKAADVDMYNSKATAKAVTTPWLSTDQSYMQRGA